MNKIVYLRKAAMDQITSLCDLNYRQKQEYDVYGAMTNITGDCVIDRTNYFWDYINTNSIYSRIPELDLTMNAGVGEYMNIVAEEYTSKYAKVFVSWSGGIDSTAVLVSLLKARKSKDQISILHTKASIEEYPWFYNEYKDDAVFELMPTDTVNEYCAWMTDQIKHNPNYILLDGHGGDCMFTMLRYILPIPPIPDLYANRSKFIDDFFKTMSNSNVDNKQLYINCTQNWHDMVRTSNIVIPGYDKEVFIRLMEEHIDNSGMKISNTFHFLWWLTFCFGFNFLIFSQGRRHAIDQPHFFKKLNFQSFYEHDLMQQWNMFVHHKDLMPYECLRDHKWAFKEYIYNFTNDSEYMNNKNKKPSWPTQFNQVQTKMTPVPLLYDDQHFFIVSGSEKRQLDKFLGYINTDKVKIKELSDMTKEMHVTLDLSCCKGPDGYPDVRVSMDNQDYWSGKVIDNHIVEFTHTVAYTDDNNTISIHFEGSDFKKYILDESGFPVNGTTLIINSIKIEKLQPLYDNDDTSGTIYTNDSVNVPGYNVYNLEKGELHIDGKIISLIDRISETGSWKFSLEHPFSLN